MRIYYPNQYVTVTKEKNIKELKGAEELDSMMVPKYQDWKIAYTSLVDEIKVRNYSPKTLKNYEMWLTKFGSFIKYKSTETLDDADIKEFLTFLAVNRNVSASTQNQAFNALLFFYRNVLKREPGEIKDIVRVKRKPCIPVVLSREEIEVILKHLPNPYDLVIKMLYGCGLKLFECMNIRLNDFNFDQNILTVHDGKGKQDRTVPIPKAILPEIQAQLGFVKEIHIKDLRAGYSGTFMFHQMEDQYKGCAKGLTWQWFFPAKQLTRVPDTYERRRYHLHESHVQKQLKQAVRKAQILKRVTCHSFRHSFASHLLAANYDIRAIQELLGHSDVRTTMIYTRTIPRRTIEEAKSPLDFDVTI